MVLEISITLKIFYHHVVQCPSLSILGSRIVNSLPIRGGEKVVIKLITSTGDFDRDGDKAFLC